VSHPIPTEVETVRVILPWPAKELSPNARAHFMAKSRATKRARHTAWGLMLEALKGRDPKLAGQPVGLNWTFHPKTANRVDDDNALAACKAYRDGIADALGTDDSQFISTIRMGEPVKGGSVLVTVRAA
jgi:crossover junction endodeoxyribonuclease RusA